MLAHPLSDRPWPLAFLRSLGQALMPGRGEIEAIYGKHGGRPGFGRRLARPFDLLARAFRYAGSRLAVRRRGRSR
jgi:hypothetical protein